MLCTKCGKNEATVYFSKTINGNKTEQHLCVECSKEIGIAEQFAKHQNYIRSRMLAPFGGFQLFSDASFPNLFDSFFDYDLLTCEPKKVETQSEKESITEVSPADKISTLRTKLQNAVNNERYEDAAKFRDEIKALEQGK